MKGGKCASTRRRRSTACRSTFAPDRSCRWDRTSSISTAKPADPIELRVYPGADGDFTLYEDENDNYDYEKGVYATIPMHWDDAAHTLTIGERKGTFPGMLSRARSGWCLSIADHGTGVESPVGAGHWSNTPVNG